MKATPSASKTHMMDHASREWEERRAIREMFGLSTLDYVPIQGSRVSMMLKDTCFDKLQQLEMQAAFAQTAVFWNSYLPLREGCPHPQELEKVLVPPVSVRG